jgi:NADH-quinone oxidoreductase subunit M
MLAQNPFAELPSEFPLLTLLTFLPAIGALLIAVLPRANERAVRGTGLFVSVLTFLVSIGLWRTFQDVVGFQLVDRASWAPGGIGYALGVDGISLLIVMLTTIITPIALLSATHAIEHRVKEFVIAVLVLETAMIGALLSIDLFLYYVFWEAMLIPMYLLIGVWGGKNRLYATTKFFIYTMAGSVLMLVAMVYVYLKGGGVSSALFDVAKLSFTFDPKAPWSGEQVYLFLAFSLAFAIKVPLFPLHTWLPDAHTEAPTAGSVILAAIMLKVGTYGFLRFAFPLFPQAAGYFSPLFMALAVIGILYGAFCAYNQTDVKKLVAYSSVSHLGFVVLGMFAMTRASVEGSILQMVNHGISTGGLFLCVGVLYERRHTRMIADYGGIAKQLPVFAVFFMIMTLSSIGLPGTNGFVGEFSILMGTFEEALSSHLDRSMSWVQYLVSWRVLTTVFAILATTGIVFGAIYMLSMFRRVMFGELKHEENKHLSDLSAREVIYLVPLVILVFGIGFFPNTLLTKISGSVAAFVEHTRPAMVQVRSPETTRAERSAAAAPTAPPPVFALTEPSPGSQAVVVHAAAPAERPSAVLAKAGE